MNKVIYRVLHERLVPMLSRIISPNQSGFVTGRSITENMLLSQEIIMNINKRKQHTNVVVKLHMAKAYDRVSWIFFTKVPRSFSFSEVLIDMIWRLVSNNWYFMLVMVRHMVVLDPQGV